MNLAGYGNYSGGGGGGGSPPTPTPWAVNVGRKGVLGLSDLTALPGSPNVITPTTALGSMGSFLANAQINSIVGWRNFATQASQITPSRVVFRFLATLINKTYAAVTFSILVMLLIRVRLLSQRIHSPLLIRLLAARAPTKLL